MNRPSEIIIERWLHPSRRTSFELSSTSPERGSSSTPIFQESFASDLTLSSHTVNAAILEESPRRWEEARAVREESNNGQPGIPTRRESADLPKFHHPSDCEQRDCQPKIPRRQTSCRDIARPKMPHRKISKDAFVGPAVFQVQRIPYEQMRRSKALLNASDHSFASFSDN